MSTLPIPPVGCPDVVTVVVLLAPTRTISSFVLIAGTRGIPSPLKSTGDPIWILFFVLNPFALSMESTLRS